MITEAHECLFQEIKKTPVNPSPAPYSPIGIANLLAPTRTEEGNEMAWERDVKGAVPKLDQAASCSNFSHAKYSEILRINLT